MGDHDATFKWLLKNPARVRAFIEERVPQLAGRIAGEPEPLREAYVSDELKQSASDLAWRVPLVGGEEAHVYFIFEHKREHGIGALLQAGSYVWSELRALFALGVRPLPLVASVIFYNGTSPWAGTRSLREAMAIPEGLEHLAMGFAPMIIDLRTEPVGELARDPALLAALTLLKAGAVPGGELREVLWRFLSASTGDEATRGAGLRYLSSVRTEEEGTTMETAVEEYREKHEPKMRSYHDALMERWEKKAQERERALREAVRRLLSGRFGVLPADAAARVAAAPESELLAWIELAGTAASLDDVFR